MVWEHAGMRTQLWPEHTTLSNILQDSVSGHAFSLWTRAVKKKICWAVMTTHLFAMFCNSRSFAVSSLSCPELTQVKGCWWQTFYSENALQEILTYAFIRIKTAGDKVQSRVNKTSDGQKLAASWPRTHQIRNTYTAWQFISEQQKVSLLFVVKSLPV